MSSSPTSSKSPKSHTTDTYTKQQHAPLVDADQQKADEQIFIYDTVDHHNERTADAIDRWKNSAQHQQYHAHNTTANKEYHTQTPPPTLDHLSLNSTDDDSTSDNSSPDSVQSSPAIMYEAAEEQLLSNSKDIPILRPEVLIATVDAQFQRRSLLSYVSPRNNNSQSELSGTEITHILAEFDVSYHNGFLPAEQPLRRLTIPKYEQWEVLMTDLTLRLQCHDSEALRDDIEALPEITVYESDFQSKAELHRCMMICSMLAHAYVWCIMPAKRHLPSQLAKPWCQLAYLCGHVPVLNYNSIVLVNWRTWNPKRAIELGNLSTLNLFYGGLDDAHFFLVSTAIEAAGAKALPLMVQAQYAASVNNIERVTQLLQQIHPIQKEIRQILRKMYDYCDPYVFFLRTRPFVDGWKGSSNLPEGLIYDGVSEDAFFLHGGSAAQSSLIAAFDEFYGVKHQHEHTREYLAGMRHYMPRGHRQFLTALGAAELDGGDIRQFILRHAEKAALALEEAHNNDVKCPFSQAKKEREQQQQQQKPVIEPPQSPNSANASWSRWITSNALRYNPFVRGQDQLRTSSEQSQHAIPSNTEAASNCPFSTVPNDPQIYGLCQAYDACLAELTAFRNLHLQIIHSYILKQIANNKATPQTQQTMPPNPEEENEARGTGGTKLLPFLQTSRDETRQCIITKHRAVPQGSST